jgi:hypothetical protein
MDGVEVSGVINGMVDDSNVHGENENVGVVTAEGAAEGAAGFILSSGDGIDGEEPTGEVRQERVVVSNIIYRMIIVAIAVASIVSKTLAACILI